MAGYSVWSSDAAAVARLYGGGGGTCWRLAIDANTAIFGVINSMLLKSLPVPDPGELACVNWTGHDVQMNVRTSGSTETLPTGQTHSNAFSYGNETTKCCCNTRK